MSNQPNQPPKSAEEVLRETNQHNVSLKYQNDSVTVAHTLAAMERYASQFARYVMDEEIDARWPITQGYEDENQAAKTMRDMIFNNVKPKV